MLTGTWYNSLNGIQGQWISTTENPYIRYGSVTPIGVYHAIDDSSGFWSYYADYPAGTWIKADGSIHGYWVYDYNSEIYGTWSFTNGTFGGQWISTTEDPMTKYVAFMPIGIFYFID